MTEVNNVDEVGLCNDRRIAADVKLTGTLVVTLMTTW